MQVGEAVIISGKLSARDEKEPQIVVDSLRPITDVTESGEWRDPVAGADILRTQAQFQQHAAGSSATDRPPAEEKKLFVKLQSADCPQYERLKLIHIMFPGREQMVIHFSDTKKSVGTKCVIHNAFIRELREMLGEENVVVK